MVGVIDALWEHFITLARRIVYRPTIVALLKNRLSYIMYSILEYCSYNVFQYLPSLKLCAASNSTVIAWLCHNSYEFASPRNTGKAILKEILNASIILS